MEELPDLASQKSQHAWERRSLQETTVNPVTTHSRPDPGVRPGSGTLAKRVAHVPADITGFGPTRTAPPVPISPSWEGRAASP